MTPDNESADTADVLADVFNSDRDRTGKEAPPETDAGQLRDERGRFAAKTEEAPADQPPPVQQGQEPPAAEAAPVDPNTGRHVPLSELLSERKQRQEKERLYQEADARAKAYEQMVQQFRQPPPQAPPQQEQAPDPWSDPQAAFAYQQRQFDERMLNERANVSEMIARQKYGDEAVEAATQAAVREGAGQHFMRQRDPYGALMQWHRHNLFLQKVGPDPDAYEKQIEQKVREKVLAELKAGNGGQPAPKFPGSLAAATGQGAQGAHLTPEAAMASVFASDRNRRSA